MTIDPLWNAIWDELKTWDINVPHAYSGYCGATGNHARAIYDAVSRFTVSAVERMRADAALMASLFSSSSRESFSKFAFWIILKVN